MGSAIMSSLTNTCYFVLLISIMLSKLHGALGLECFIANCSSASCMVGFGRYVVTCKADEVCMKFVSSPRDHPESSLVVVDKPVRFSRTAKTQYVRLEKGCRPLNVIASHMTKKVIEDKHFCEDLSIIGSFGAKQPGTRCWCWDSDRCNVASNLSYGLTFLRCISQAFASLLLSQYLVLSINI